jgi:hypothetical protein
MELKEFHSMKKPRGLFLALALGALMGVSANQARAGTITMTVDITAGSFVVDAVALPGLNTYTVDAAGIAVLNAFLSGNGSEYQFVGLQGSSNFPGSSQGQLVLTGEIHSVVGGGSDSFLKITESQSDFTSPTGPSGTLMSSSTGNFTNQPSGGGHAAESLFNATTTGPYSVLSSGTAVNGQAGSASAAVAPVPTLYTLTNNITFGLAPAGANDIVDSFGVTATITAAAIPEPASLIMMLTGMPLPLVVLGLLRRRRVSS